MITIDFLDIIIIVILHIFMLILIGTMFVWYIEKKFSNMAVNLPAIKIARPKVLLKISEDTKNNKISLVLNNPNDGNDNTDCYYDVEYF